MFFGAVRDNSTTATTITAKAPNAMATLAGLALKRSSNTHTLSAMLAKGLTTTRIGSETLSGPKCKADCSSNVPAADAAARA